MKTIKMLAVAPYKGLGDFLIYCAKSFPDIELTVISGNMRGAAKNLERYQGYDIVVSRGGTAQILRENLLIPVIEVEVSVYDMLRVIKMAQQTGKKFAIVGFDSLIKTSRIICEIMQYTVPAYTIASEEDAGRVTGILAQNGTELVVGDVVSSDHADLAGLPSLLIASGAESVEKAFVDTMLLFQNIERLNRNSPYRDVLEASPQELALFDSNNLLFYANRAFQSHPQAERSALTQLLLELIPQVAAEGDLRLHRRFGGAVLGITGLRLGDEKISSYAFYITSRARLVEHDDVVKIESPDPLWRQAGSPAFLDAERLRLTVDQIMSGPKRPAPVIISGRPGTGVSALARYIHSAGPFKNSLFISLDSRGLTEKAWHNIVKNTDSPLHDLKCSLFLQNVHLLSYSVQNMLCDYMEDTLLATRHQLIASTAVDLTALVANNEFLPALYQKLNGLCISLPSLRERPEEIPALASLFINHYNREFTKQIIGFEDEALEYLKHYPWELNLEELENLIRQLIMLAEKPYITLADARRNLAAIQRTSPDSPPINLNKTFAEIERDILLHVLAEEGMNQSRAAKRLGIGRSTLWRKIGGGTAVMLAMVL